MKRYVVLYGQTGVSQEFKTLSQARKYAQNKANERKGQVEIDHLNIYKDGDFSQGHEEYVTPNLKKEIKRRKLKGKIKSNYGLNFKVPQIDVRSLF